MVVIKYPDRYVFIRFEKSNTKNKKYDAILKNKKTRIHKRVSFGDSRYEQYQDKALGLYKSKNHFDKKRRANYYSRHGRIAPKFSSKWFSHKYLW